MTKLMTHRPGYQLSYFLGEPPFALLDPVLSWAVALRNEGDVLLASETKFADLGPQKITLLPIKDAARIKTLRWTPLIAERRGTRERAKEGSIRIDTAIWTNAPFVPMPEEAPSTPRVSASRQSLVQCKGDAPHCGSTPRSDRAPSEKPSVRQGSIARPAVTGKKGRTAVSPRATAKKGAATSSTEPRRTNSSPLKEAPEADEFRELATIKTVLDRIGALEARAIAKERDTATVVAVIDQGFDDTELFHWGADPAILEVERVVLPFSQNQFASTSYDHGNRAASALRSTLRKSNAKYLVRRIVIGPTVPMLEPLALAKAIALAVFPKENGSSMPNADVVLIPMSSGQWGMPRYLDAALSSAAKAGRRGKGAVVVCSTGDRGTNQGQTVDPKLPYGSAALGADELASHPDVLTVAPCDLEGRWLRTAMSDPNHTGVNKKLPRKLKAEMDLDGRFGPSVVISAPANLVVLLDEDPATTDDPYNFDGSSFASTIVAGCVVRVLQNNPHLNPHHVRQLLKETAHVPIAPDRAYGAEASIAPRFDRLGHNAKVGAGMVNVLSASLAAKDPVCQVLLRIAEAAPPPSTQFALLTNPPLLMARWFDYRVAQLSEENKLAEAYCNAREFIAKALLAPSPLREEVEWMLRHLFFVFTQEGPNNWFSIGKTHVNHGALIRRLVRLSETLRSAMKNESSTQTFLAMFEQVTLALEASKTGSATLERTLRNLFLGETFGTRGIADERAPILPMSVLRRSELS